MLILRQGQGSPIGGHWWSVGPEGASPTPKDLMTGVVIGCRQNLRMFGGTWRPAQGSPWAECVRGGRASSYLVCLRLSTWVVRSHGFVVAHPSDKVVLWHLLDVDHLQAWDLDFGRQSVIFR